MYKIVKTSELTGAALDWAVAKCEGRIWAEAESFLAYHDEGEMAYANDWTQGGPIIEREAISVFLGLPVKGLEWMACDRGSTFVQHGPTPLVAAMRCYVASKLGDTVDIPEELA